MIALFNLTPHDMHVFAMDTPDRIDPAQHEPIRVYPASGELARAGGNELGTWPAGAEQVMDVEYRGVTGLPPYAGDMFSRDRKVWYLVSLVTALSAMPRGDLLVPYLPVRDLAGRVVGCRAFSRPV